jgi:uncharacterized glyoxalase superfamily protein PhnB
MKMKSVSGIALGFEFKKREENRVTIKLNWFWMDFLQIDAELKSEFQKEANLENKGAGHYLYISVENVDEAYQDLISKGLKPSSEPRDWPWGNREFVIRDPDGYKLVIFKRK